MRHADLHGPGALSSLAVVGPEAEVVHAPITGSGPFRPQHRRRGPDSSRIGARTATPPAGERLVLSDVGDRDRDRIAVAVYDPLHRDGLKFVVGRPQPRWTCNGRAAIQRGSQSVG